MLKPTRARADERAMCPAPDFGSPDSPDSPTAEVIYEHSRCHSAGRWTAMSDNQRDILIRLRGDVDIAAEACLATVIDKIAQAQCANVDIDLADVTFAGSNASTFCRPALQPDYPPPRPSPCAIPAASSKRCSS
jgi:hypothetical protein